MRLALGLLAVYGIVVGVRWLAAGAIDDGLATATLNFGVVLILSFFAGRLTARLGVPAITGYILAGLLLGPQLLSGLPSELGILRPESIARLRLLDHLAVGLIALTAGGELKLARLRTQLKRIAWTLGAMGILVPLGVGAAVLCLRPLWPALAELAWAPAMGVALLLGTVALANSPAIVIAVTQEGQTRGPLTDLVIGVTMFKDVVVVLIFTVVLALVHGLLSADGGPAGSGPAWELIGSLALGLTLGWVMRQVLRRSEREGPLVVLGAVLLSAVLASELHLSSLLMCMVAGFYIENHTRQGEKLIHGIERHALPVYIVFFTIAGAGLDLAALRQCWPLALGVALTRVLMIGWSLRLATGLSGAEPQVCRHAWSGFVGQAAVTLGLATIIGERLGDTGTALRTVLVAVVAINQISGPILFRRGLARAGELGRATSE